MSNYVEIKTSIADILSIANGLRTRGEALTGTMKSAIEEIRKLEDDSETFPKDDFTDGFLPLYNKDIPAGDGTTLHANLAVQKSAIQMGEVLERTGQNVANAMWNYHGTDDDNATDISKAGNA
jgi:hypothetical protein